MAAALQVADQMICGEELVIDGTGFANTTAFTVDLTLPGIGAPSITLKGTTSGAGAITGSDVATVIPSAEGIITVKASDGTSTVTSTVEVFRSI